MGSMEQYEKLIEEFSYKAYTYAGDTIKLDVADKSDGFPTFIMKNSDLENKLNVSQKQELYGILDKAMAEVVKCKPENKSVKEFLGWS